MSCQRTPPPVSPRAPKIQQQSWDDCNSPPIDLFDPYRQDVSSPPRSPSTIGQNRKKQPPIILQQPPKSPKSSRKFNKPSNNVNCYYDVTSVVVTRSPTTTSSVYHHASSRSFNSFQVASNNSPKYDNPPRSPKITTTSYGNNDVNDDDATDGVGAAATAASAVILNNGGIEDDDNNDDECITSASSSNTSYYQTPTSGSRSPKPSCCGSAGPGSGSGGGGGGGSLSSAGGGGFNSTGYYTSDSHNQSPRPSPKSPRKFVFDAISPSYEQQSRNFDYYDQNSPEEQQSSRHCNTGSNSAIYHHGTSTGRELPMAPGQLINQNRRNSKNFTSRPLPNPNIIASGCIHNDDNVNKSSGFGAALNNTSRNSCDPIEKLQQHNNGNNNGSRYKHHNQMHIQQNQQQQQQQQQLQQNQQQQSHLLDEFPTGTRNLFLKRDSCMTESTQLSGDSCETNLTNNTMTTSLSCESPVQSPLNNNGKKPGGGGGNGGCCNNSHNGGCTTNNNNGGVGARNINAGDSNNFTSNSANGKTNDVVRKEKVGRRHAINITSNPGYQVLHSSHSTLDRTCSDSVVSLRYRKSTSDLTNIDDGNGISTGGYNITMSASTKPIRRRGSSKGGLAYLASRRSSRESIKSACSNASLFSNEDVGPLAFQSSSRGRQRRTSNFLELPVPDHIRPRVCSLPDRPYNPRVSDDLYRLRHFSISKGTVVNCGDSIISRRSRSNTSVNSTTSRASERSPFEGSCCGGGYANVDSLPPSPTDSEDPPPPPRYRIVMLGDAGVGKTALVSQFMTSEYMHTYDASLDDEFGEKTVCILLDNEESELVFIDHPSVEMSVENSLSTYEPHGCVIVYSVVDRNSFRVAEDTINYLWREGVTKEKAVILVANKCDLARSRMITSNEGKALAANRDIKFIETSSGIQHNVDELLVGTLKQIRLKEKRDKKMESKMKSSKTHISLHLAKEILQKICLTDITKSKSCENLHVL